MTIINLAEQLYYFFIKSSMFFKLLTTNLISFIRKLEEDGNERPEYDILILFLSDLEVLNFEYGGISCNG